MLHPRVLLALALLALAPGTAAQVVPPSPDGAPVTLSLGEALEIAVERNYGVLTSALDVENARLQVREAYGQLYPRVEASGSYTRNVVSANPFAGSDAGGLFGALGALDWLAYNEQARTDDDPATEPLSLEEFRRRQGEGQTAAGVPAAGENPFSVPNAFQSGISVSQPLYSGTAFAAVRGARSLVEINQAALVQRRDELVHQVRQQFYAALLAQEQAAVLEASVTRTGATVTEVARLVAQGVQPKLQRLSAEVDLANLETQLIQARAGAEAARDQLLFTLGLPVGQPVVLRGELDLPPTDAFRTVGFADAVATALDRRPDLEQARLAIRLQEVQRDITRAAALPSVSAFANLGYAGNVPDNRAVFTQTGPFTYERGPDRSFFSDAYWQPSLSVGLRLNWTLFDGFQTRYRAQQNTIAIEQAEVALAQAEQGARLEVAQALRTLESARQRVASAGQNVARAETAYAFADDRLRVGVATQLDVRQASEGLDQARLNYVQAVYDVLVARSNLERATGTIAPPPVLLPDGRITLLPPPSAEPAAAPVLPVTDSAPAPAPDRAPAPGS